MEEAIEMMETKMERIQCIRNEVIGGHNDCRS
jgi:hypothetical protein